ncbi:MAG: hypothetical protein R3E66_06610 [bacterium]
MHRLLIPILAVTAACRTVEVKPSAQPTETAVEQGPIAIPFDPANSAIAVTARSVYYFARKQGDRVLLDSFDPKTGRSEPVCVATVSEVRCEKMEDNFLTLVGYGNSEIYLSQGRLWGHYELEKTRVTIDFASQRIWRDTDLEGINAAGVLLLGPDGLTLVGHDGTELRLPPEWERCSALTMADSGAPGLLCADRRWWDPKQTRWWWDFLTGHVRTFEKSAWTGAWDDDQITLTGPETLQFLLPKRPIGLDIDRVLNSPGDELVLGVNEDRGRAIIARLKNADSYKWYEVILRERGKPDVILSGRTDRPMYDYHWNRDLSRILYAQDGVARLIDGSNSVELQPSTEVRGARFVGDNIFYWSGADGWFRYNVSTKQHARFTGTWFYPGDDPGEFAVYTEMSAWNGENLCRTEVAGNRCWPLGGGAKKRTIANRLLLLTVKDQHYVMELEPGDTLAPQPVPPIQIPPFVLQSDE